MLEREEGEGEAEVFAHFGAASYYSNVFEGELAVSVLCLDFVSELKDEIGYGALKAISGTELQSRFESYLRTQRLSSVSELLSTLARIGRLSPEIHELLHTARQQREFLVHHFWRENATAFVNTEGRRRMVGDLRSSQEVFLTANAALLAMTDGALASIGLTLEVMRGHFGRFAARMKPN